MTLNMHARIEIAAILLIALTSCSDRHTMAETYDLADVARVNSANALYQVDELESRVSEIEAKLAM